MDIPHLRNMADGPNKKVVIDIKTPIKMNVSFDRNVSSKKIAYAYQTAQEVAMLQPIYDSTDSTSNLPKISDNGRGKRSGGYQQRSSVSVMALPKIHESSYGKLQMNNSQVFMDNRWNGSQNSNNDVSRL